MRFFLLFVLFALLSQKPYAQSFNIGALAGINASQISGDNYSGFNKAGILLGMYSNTDVSEKINLQFEINYSQKGSRKNPDTENGDTEFFLLRLNYMEVPIMIRWKLNRLKLEAGVYYSRLISEHIEDEIGVFSIPENLNQFKNNDLGGLVGLNYHLSDHIIMNWRYSNSFIPVRDFDSGASFRFNSGMFHSYLSFNIRYEFIGKNGE
ncbi:MAG: PorT family protein [Bacteroidetes bacterium]|nr:MAG: PorT family protein [Bacteroidota bacterium]MBL1143377.1 PorT family protein [Bacteroidota bacterium]MCB0803032.1 PorT family protein [Flavobacteriales bacterium]NOG56180.1 PorT family protein [Bacteroidota bacterium]